MRNGDFERHLGGIDRPFNTRVIAHRFPVFELNLQPGVDHVVYLRVQSRGTLSVSTHLWEPNAFLQDSLRTYASLSLFFGLMLGLSLYNLMLYFSTRDPAYLIEVGFVSSMAFYQLALSGLGA